MLAPALASCASTGNSNLEPVKLDPGLFQTPAGPVEEPKTRTETEQAALVNGQRLNACIFQIQEIRKDLELRDQIQFGG